MGRVESHDPDRMVFRSGGGCIAFFGLPFLIVGVAVMTSPLWGPMKDSKTGEAVPLLLVVPFGAVFATVGAALVLGRAGKTFDRRSGTVTTWWGLLVPFKTTTRPLAEFASVSISKEIRRSKNSTYTVYPVRLASEKGKDVNIEEPRDMGKARQAAEEVAKFLDLRLVDSSMGQAVVREADELDESLRERAQRTGERPDMPEPPPDCRSTHSVVGDTLVFDLPPSGFRVGHYVMMGVGLIFPLFAIGGFLALVFAQKGPPGPMMWVMGLFIGVFFVAVPLLVTWGAAFSSAKARTKIEVSPRLLQVSVTGLVRTKTTAIPTDELEELELIRPGKSDARNLQAAFGGASEVILARSDQASVSFGVGLSKNELEWMKAVIQSVVTV